VYFLRHNIKSPGETKNVTRAGQVTVTVRQVRVSVLLFALRFLRYPISNKEQNSPANQSLGYRLLLVMRPIYNTIIIRYLQQLNA
jgi:hypothetical protein